MTGREGDPEEDRTVVVQRLDETVIAPRRASPPAAGPGADEARDPAGDDRPAPGSGEDLNGPDADRRLAETVEDDDHDRTVVSGRFDRTVQVSRSGAVRNGNERPGSPAAPPERSLEQPDEENDRESRELGESRDAGEVEESRSAGPLRRTEEPRIPPSRRIPAVPGNVPWASMPVPEAGVRPGLPVIYGARSPGAGAPDGLDGIQRRLGPPPAAPAAPLAAAVQRPALPSLERRTRRRRIVTLACYAAAILASGFGLWGVAVLAFG